MSNKVYLGDIGTVITLDCGQDVSAATSRRVYARKPDGTEVTWTASAAGTNGISYTTLAGTLDQVGVWKLQAGVTLPTGTWRGETASLPVYANFN